jgi:hypothetical protein
MTCLNLAFLQHMPLHLHAPSGLELGDLVGAQQGDRLSHACCGLAQPLAQRLLHTGMPSTTAQNLGCIACHESMSTA